ncbi:hypothetical protein D3C71_1213560 [compost metagenome]
MAPEIVLSLPTAPVVSAFAPSTTSPAPPSEPMLAPVVARSMCTCAPAALVTVALAAFAPSCSRSVPWLAMVSMPASALPPNCSAAPGAMLTAPVPSAPLVSVASVPASTSVPPL